jgi:hypothetical protein
LRFTVPTQATPAPVARPEPQPLQQPAAQAPQAPKEEPFATTADRGRPLVTLSPRPPGDPGPAPGQAWTWRDVLAGVDDSHVVPLEPRRQAHAAAQAAAQSHHPASHGALAVSSRPRHPIEAINIIDAVGIQLSETFAPNMLDRVAQRARNGAHARRRAVRDAAPEAVEALTAYLSQDADSRAATSDFLRAEGPRLTELLGRGRAAMQADITRAFLLLDAASG